MSGAEVAEGEDAPLPASYTLASAQLAGPTTAPPLPPPSPQTPWGRATAIR